jgi:hypothetical protein
VMFFRLFRIHIGLNRFYALLQIWEETHRVEGQSFSNRSIANCTESFHSRRNQFKCDNGDIISKEYVCNSIADCSDQSDETLKVCEIRNKVCGPYSARCTYGACIDADKTCDGVSKMTWDTTKSF